MDLKKRLAQLDKLTRKPSAAGAEDPGRVGTSESLAELGLAESPGPGGSVWTRSHFDRVPAPRNPFPDLRELFSGRIDPDLTSADILFMDTETTGLAGGTGTIPFLVGMSWWGPEGLHTRQFFLPDPGQEPALLNGLSEIAAGFRVVVTFNGASYDLPLMRTRARMNRLDDPFASLTGWDLLVPARRLWGNRLDNCRQQTLETEICGISRGPGDIEGPRIPQTWFDFLGSGRVGLLPRVVTHNHRDMVGMCRLFLKVIGAAVRLEDGECPPAGRHWREEWALGRICERRRDTARSVACLKTAVGAVARRTDGGLADPRFLGDAVRILKRGCDWTLVEQVITGGLAAGVDQPWIHREAAILYEHRRVDLPKALDHALKSGEDNRVARLRRMMDSG